MRPLLSYISQRPVVLIIICRVLTGAALMTAIQSVFCTLLISVQVGIIKASENKNAILVFAFQVLCHNVKMIHLHL